MKMYKDNRKYHNINKALYKGVGIFDIPEVEKVEEMELCDFIDFKNSKKCKNRSNFGVHFFIDDYQFECVWSSPNRYVEYLSQFKYVLAPDFSLYTDFPKSIQIYNHYRKHWLARYMKDNGVNIIPTIAWSDATSFEWCFDGEPKESVVAVSSVGTMRSKTSKELFMQGYKEMMKVLHPGTILFFGNIPAECEGNIIKLDTYQERFRK